MEIAAMLAWSLEKVLSEKFHFVDLASVAERKRWGNGDGFIIDVGGGRGGLEGW
jgi:hypothetical protein